MKLETKAFEDTTAMDNHTTSDVSPTQHYIIGSYLICIGLLGTFTNGIVVIMFLRFRVLVTPTNTLLLNLALADLGLCLFGFPFSASSSLSNRWLFGDGGCQWYAFMGFLFGSASIGTLTLIALDRYLIICRQEIRGKLSFRRYTQMLTLCWIYAFLWALFPLIGWGRYGMEPSSTTCTIDWRNNDTNYKSFILVYFVLGFAIPVAIQMLCYYSAARQISNTKNRVPSNRAAAYSDWANQKYGMKLCLVLVTGFIVFWSPYAIVCLWTVFSTPDSVPTEMALLPPLVAKASTVFNPVVFFLCHPKFRKGMILTATCCCNDTPRQMMDLADKPCVTSVGLEDKDQEGNDN